MKKGLNILMLLFFLTANYSKIVSAPFDTGMTTLEQPNNVTFTGRIWGDEFFFWAETEFGYRFIQSGDGYYYYAALDSTGEYTPTIYKVGIDSPPPSSYQLDRTQARIDEISQQIEEFNEQVELNRQWYAQKQAEADAQGQPSVNLKIGIILIEFTDVEHYKTDLQGNRPNGYFKTDFENMMFSENYWYEPDPRPGFPSPHPENEPVFGSFKDYWLQMSKSNLRVGGQVVNPPDQNEVPVWIEADHTREYYANLPAFDRTLVYEAIQKAIALGYISENPGNPNYYDKYAVVYAQQAIFAGALMVHAEAIGGKYHFIAERSGTELYGGNLQSKSFTHIGIYAHEFAHTIGLFDEYDGRDDGSTDLFNFCLMGWGIYNGPERKSACPATLSPWYRIDYGWIPQPIVINSDQVNFLVEYDYSNPKLYKIDPIGPPVDMHYLFEIRKRQGFDSYVPEPPETYQNQSGTLLIWQHNIESPIGGSPYHDRIRVKAADFVLNKQTQLNDFFPSSIYQNSQNLNDITYPTASLGDYREEYFPFLIRPAHFALNEIQKLVNGNTLVGEIKLNHAIVKNENSGSWQLVSVPVGLTDYSLSSVFPTAISAYKYQSGYVQVTTLENGPGYWTKFPSQPQTLIQAGTVIEYLEIPVTTGWNMTGTISDKVPVPNVCSNPPGIIQNIYSYSTVSGYTLLTESDSLKPGIGYWTKTTAAGNIILDRYAEPCELAKITSIPQIDFSSMDKFIITDSESHSQSLYVSNIDIDTAMSEINLDLPPFFFEMEFDSRFEYNEFVKKVSADSGTINLNILVHTPSFPVTLTWELNPANGVNYSFIGDSGLGKILNIESVSGKTSFSSLTNNKIQLVASGNKASNSTSLPKEYSLEQNYPNPFNPSTSIRYSIREKEFVTLKVYDILGNEIAKLVDEEKQAGDYSINFDASDLSSGIYFYNISAGNFHLTKKMILMR